MTVPACMSDIEFAAWVEKNEAIPKPEWRASTPCLDCPHWFAQEQRELGSCDGRPGMPRRQQSPRYLTAEYKREKARDWRRRNGMVTAEERMQAVTARMQERVSKAVQLREAGLKNVEIARHLGVQRKTVCEYLKRAAS